MGTADTQGDLWGKAVQDWASIQEPMGRPLWEAMLDEARVGSGTHVLDAGCGGGGASVLAAERGARVSGIDAAEEMIAFVSERVPGHSSVSASPAATSASVTSNTCPMKMMPSTSCSPRIRFSTRRIG
jgi:SAM-dependent methyltransferase